MPRLAPLACLGLTALAGGCLSPHPAGLTIEYQPGKKAETFQAPYAAVYELMLVDELEPSPPLIGRVLVKRQDHVGFVREPDGTLVGYAGGWKSPLPDRNFRWRITPETQRTQSSLYREYTRQLLRGIGIALAPVADAAVDGIIEATPELVEDAFKKHPHEPGH